MRLSWEWDHPYYLQVKAATLTVTALRRSKQHRLNDDARSIVIDFAAAFPVSPLASANLLPPH
ncbi:MAG: hypothetical protein K0R67_3129 [Paenibacillus sp.]|jgi:hypothetical protein|nr:hypothetical protein [Paenibacillus sp.]